MAISPHLPCHSPNCVHVCRARSALVCRFWFEVEVAHPRQPTQLVLGYKIRHRRWGPGEPEYLGDHGLAGLDYCGTKVTEGQPHLLWHLRDACRLVTLRLDSEAVAQFLDVGPQLSKLTRLSSLRLSWLHYDPKQALLLANLRLIGTLRVCIPSCPPSCPLL